MPNIKVVIGANFGDEGKGPVVVHSDDHGDDQAFLVLRRSLGVEGFAEVHDVHAVLAQGRAHRRRGSGFPRGNLKLYHCCNALCHFL